MTNNKKLEWEFEPNLLGYKLDLPHGPCTLDINQDEVNLDLSEKSADGLYLERVYYNKGEGLICTRIEKIGVTNEVSLCVKVSKIIENKEILLNSNGLSKKNKRLINLVFQMLKQEFSQQ